MRTKRLPAFLIAALSLIALWGCETQNQLADPAMSETLQPVAAEAEAPSEPAPPLHPAPPVVLVVPIRGFGVEAVYEAARQVIYEQMNLKPYRIQNRRGFISDGADSLTATITAQSSEEIVFKVRINYLSEDVSEMSITAENYSDRPHDLQRYCRLIFDRTRQELSDQAPQNEPEEPSAVFNEPILKIHEQLSKTANELKMDVRDMRLDGFSGFILFRSGVTPSTYRLSYNLTGPDQTRVSLRPEGPGSENADLIFRTIMDKLVEKLSEPTPPQP